MSWTVPEMSWWTTREYVDHWYPPEPDTREDDQSTAWDALTEGRIGEEDESLLHMLAKRENDRTADQRTKPFHPVKMVCWAADLFCDHHQVAVAESPAFRARGDLVTFIRWLAVHGQEISDREGSPSAKTASELRWEAQFGPPRGWRVPETPEAAEWVLNIPKGKLTLYCYKEPVFTTFDLRPREVPDFLAWFRDDMASIKIDPSRSEILGVDEAFLPCRSSSSPE